MTETNKGKSFMSAATENFKNNKSMRLVGALAILAVAFLVYLIATSGNADAVSAGSATLHTQFDQMWDEVKGLLTGSPAKVLMGLGILGVLMFSVVKPNLIGFAASVVTLLVVANAAGTIDTSLTITVESLKALKELH
jgi:hypothetical protein